MENIVNLVIEQLSSFYAMSRIHFSTYQKVIFLQINGIVQKISFHSVNDDTQKKWQIVVQTDCVSHFIPHRQNCEVLNSLNREASCFSFVFAGTEKGIVTSTTFSCLSTIPIQDLQIVMNISLLQCIGCQKQRDCLIQKCGCSMPFYGSWLDEYCRNIDVDYVQLKKIHTQSIDKLSQNMFKSLQKKDSAPLKILTTSWDKKLFVQTLAYEEDSQIKLVMSKRQNEQNEGGGIDVSFQLNCKENPLSLVVKLNANSAFASLAPNVFGSFIAEGNTLIYHALYLSFFTNRVDIGDIYSDILILITNFMNYLQVHSVHHQIRESLEASFDV